MKKKFKIMTIAGTRPELIKLSLFFKSFERYFDHIFVHTGQNYDYSLNKIFFEDLELPKPNYYLSAAGKTAVQTICNVISKIEPILLQERPDAVIVYGDTNSCLSIIAAKKLKIPIFHFEAGNRSFDQNVPEEINRKIVDHLSDINFVLTEHARRYLIKEGIEQDRIFKTGSHLYEVLEKYNKKIKSSKILNKIKLSKNKYFLLSFHREENVDSPCNLRKIIDAIDQIWKTYRFKIVVSTHPRTQERLKNIKNKINKNILFSKPFGFFDYICLQKNAFCTISDSGTITEESSILNFPAITIRNSHERPEGMDSGILIMSGLDSDKVIEAIKITNEFHNKLKKNKKTPNVTDYKNISVENQVIKIIYSYIDYVKRNVWKMNV